MFELFFESKMYIPYIQNTKSNLSISPTIFMYIYVFVHMKTYIIYEGTILLMMYVVIYIYTYVQIIQSARGELLYEEF